MVVRLLFWHNLWTTATIFILSLFLYRHPTKAFLVTSPTSRQQQQHHQKQQQEQEKLQNVGIIPTWMTHIPPFMSSSSAQQNDENDDDELPVDRGTHDELMYALGVNLARQLGDVRPLVESGEELAKVAKGLLDTVVGRLSDEGQRQLLARRGQDLNVLIQARANAIKERLHAAGRDMLENMKQTAGVEVLPSGVVLHVLEHGPEGPGQGVRPTRSSTVKIHYHGTLADGTIFDTTLGGDPVTFPLAGVIPGWRDGVLKMHQGETAMLGIPPDQAYGDQGTPDGRIPGGSTLFFKIQLLEVMSAGIGGSPTLLGADGKKLATGGNARGSSGLLGPDGKPF